MRLVCSQKPKRGGRQAVQEYKNNSRINVAASAPGAPRLLQIELHGELAQLPNIKNSRLITRSGQSIIKPDSRARLIAMTQLYIDLTYGQAPAPFGKEEIHVTVICAKRPRTFDPIGCLESVQDWLEPATYLSRGQVKDRGWGIGLIENDRHITGYALHSRALGYNADHSTILITPLNEIRAGVIRFISEHYLLFGGQETGGKDCKM